jgi:hypothetical protein
MRGVIMSNNLFEEYNNVKLQGKIVSEKVFNHDIYGEKFYKFNLEVPRLSENVDIIPIIISERLMIEKDLGEGKLIKITYNTIKKYINKIIHIY